MSFPKWSGTVVGVIVGVIIGAVTDNIVSFFFLGLMFGLIGDIAYQRMQKK